MSAPREPTPSTSSTSETAIAMTLDAPARLVKLFARIVERDLRAGRAPQGESVTEKSGDADSNSEVTEDHAMS